MQRSCGVIATGIGLALLSAAIAPVRACVCGPNLDAPNVYVIVVSAIEHTQTKDVFPHTASEVQLTTPFTVSYRVTATLKGFAHTSGKLMRETADVFTDCGPPIVVGVSYVIALMNLDQPKVTSCSFYRVLREGDIEMVQQILRKQEMLKKPDK